MARMMFIPVTPVISLRTLVELDIHQMKRLLHVLNMRCTTLEQILAIAHQGTNGTNIFTGMKGWQETIAMQLLNALTVQHICLWGLRSDAHGEH